MRLFAFAVAFAAFAATPAFAAPDLTGEWKGGYVSDTGQDNNSFELKLASSGGVITGSGVEFNAFGDDSVLFLLSTVAGKATDDGAISFTKTYDGSGGVSHSVTYVGRLEPGGRRIRGTFNAGGSTGAFEMVR